MLHSEQDMSGDESESNETADAGVLPTDGGARRPRFWRVFGIASAADIGLVLLYTLIVPGFRGNALSDALCASAVVLGLIGMVPAVLDMGRGVALPATLEGDSAAQRASLLRERQRREQGMTVTLALGAAMVFVGLLSFLISLL